MIELKHLRLLGAIEQLGTLSAAARSLGYSQSAATQQVRALERRLGTTLLLRSSQGVRLTEAGVVLIRRGRVALDAVLLAAREVDALAALEAGHVRLAAFASGAAAILPSALGRMSRTYPGIRFSMDELEPADALAQLRRGECDVALVYEYIRDGMPTRTFETEEGEPAVPLLDELIWLALPKDHPNVSMRYAALSDFVDARWIAGCITCRSNLMELCSEAGFTPDIHFVTDDYIALQRLVKEGLGIALLPDLMVLNGESNDFVVRPFEPRCFRRVFAVTTSSHMTVPAVAATIEMLRRTSSELRPRRTY